MNYSRRDFLTGFTKRLAARLADTAQASAQAINAAAKTTQNTSNRITKAAFLRPPGALEEPQFLDTCDRECVECIKACPYQAIKRLGYEFGEAAEGTPAIIVDETPCYMCADFPCIEVCPTDALQLIPRNEVKMGLAKIDYDKCYVSQGQPCDYCVVRCPLDRDAIDWDENCLPRVIDNGCAGCGVCAYLCPANAINILPV